MQKGEWFGDKLLQQFLLFNNHNARKTSYMDYLSKNYSSSREFENGFKIIKIPT